MKLYYLLLFVVNVCFIYAQNSKTPVFTQYFYANGIISSEGNLINGKPEGLWKSYYPDSKLKSVGKWIDNKLDSVWTFYYSNGLIERKINYFNGKKNGYEYFFSLQTIHDTVTSILKSEELYLNGLKEGISKYYFDNGEIQYLKRFKNNKEEGICYEYDIYENIISVLHYRKGKLIEREDINRYNKDSLKVGLWKSFYLNGKLKSEESYLNDTLNGISKSYDEGGNLLNYWRFVMGDTIFESVADTVNTILKIEYYDAVSKNGDSVKKFSGSFIHNKPIGVHRYYDIYGKINSSKLFDSNSNLIGEGIVDEEGNKIGNWKFYYNSGKLKSKGNYVKNKRSGTWSFYFENGKIEQTGNFENDKYNGLWKWFNLNGELLREENFERGVQNGSYIEYDDDRNIITAGEYLDGLKEGFWMDKSGTHIEEGQYKSGLKDGEWIYKYKNNVVYFKGSFLFGVPEGKHLYYHENAIIKREENYNNGLKVDNWYYWDYYGSLMKTCTFANNILTEINGIKIVD